MMQHKVAVPSRNNPQAQVLWRAKADAALRQGRPTSMWQAYAHDCTPFSGVRINRQHRVAFSAGLDERITAWGFDGTHRRCALFSFSDSRALCDSAFDGVAFVNEANDLMMLDIGTLDPTWRGKPLVCFFG